MVNNVNQLNIVSSVLNTSAYGASFSDIAKVDLSDNAEGMTVNNVNIVVGSTTIGGDPNISSSTACNQVTTLSEFHSTFVTG